MRRLSLIISTLVVVVIVFSIGKTGGDSPHGPNLKYNCSECHTPSGWKLDSTHSFNHGSTGYDLLGEHKSTSCTDCHTSLVFEDVKTNCFECHTDVHEQTVGNDCEKCHNNNSWIISDFNRLHRLTRFPLLGSHATADCDQCHKSASELQFQPISSECVSCHLDEYNLTSKPNHQASGFSTVCENCHSSSQHEWSSKGFIHPFFPLTLGHNISECSRCHDETNYKNISSDCYSCHQADYNSANDPNHVQSNFPLDCQKCHNTNPGWKPSTFDHSSYFPIYSGSHDGEWNSCTDCHNNASNFSSFSCLDCHEHNKDAMDRKHSGKSRYKYESSSCLNCHPKGR